MKQLQWLLVVAAALLAAATAAKPAGIEDASEVLNSVFKDCTKSWSYTCVQKKVLVFVDRLDSVRSIRLLDGWSVENVEAADGRALRHPITEQELSTVSGRAADAADQVLSDMIDNKVDEFFRHRVLRMSVPSEVSNIVSARGITDLPTFDFALGESDNGEARLKKKKKLKLKALLIGLLLVGGIKLIKLMPVFLALIKLKAIKAILFSVISLAITLGGAARGLIQRKLALFSSPMKHVKTVEVWLAPMKGGHSSGHGDSYGSHSGGGGGHGGGHGGGGHDSYSAPSYSGGGGGGGGGYDSYSSGYSSGGGGDSYSVGGGSYSGASSQGWQSKSDGADLAYRAHAK